VIFRTKSEFLFKNESYLAVKIFNFKVISDKVISVNWLNIGLFFDFAGGYHLTMMKVNLKMKVIPREMIRY